MSSKFETFKTVGGNPDKHYAILRVAKLKTKGSVAAALSHNLRERETLNADKERFHENTILKGANTVQGGLQAWDARAPEKVRINAVHGLEYFVGGSPDRINALSRTEQDAYFSKALEWFEDRHGAENIISAVVHRDETTPHMQIVVIPLDERNKLNARALVGGKDNLRQLQTNFAEQVGLEFGLQRGIERSNARHHTIKEYYARAQTPLKDDLTLPERRVAGGIGSASETDEEWRQRASEAAIDQIYSVNAHLVEENIRLNRKILAESANHESEKQSANMALDFLGIGIDVVKNGVENFELDDLRLMAKAFNSYLSRWNEEQIEGIKKVLPDLSIEIIQSEDGDYAILTSDLENIGRGNWRGYTHQQLDKRVDASLRSEHKHSNDLGGGLKL
jgi:hypothetical protein